MFLPAPTTIFSSFSSPSSSLHLPPPSPLSILYQFLINLSLYLSILISRIFFVIYLFIIVSSLCYTLPVLTSVRDKYHSTVLEKAMGL